MRNDNPDYSCFLKLNKKKHKNEKKVASGPLFAFLHPNDLVLPRKSKWRNKPNCMDGGTESASAHHPNTGIGDARVTRDNIFLPFGARCGKLLSSMSNPRIHFSGGKPETVLVLHCFILFTFTCLTPF